MPRQHKPVGGRCCHPSYRVLGCADVLHCIEAAWKGSRDDIMGLDNSQMTAGCKSTGAEIRHPELVILIHSPPWLQCRLWCGALIAQSFRPS